MEDAQREVQMGYCYRLVQDYPAPADWRAPVFPGRCRTAGEKHAVMTWLFSFAVSGFTSVDVEEFVAVVKNSAEAGERFGWCG